MVLCTLGSLGVGLATTLSCCKISQIQQNLPFLPVLVENAAIFVFLSKKRRTRCFRGDSSLKGSQRKDILDSF